MNKAYICRTKGGHFAVYDEKAVAPDDILYCPSNKVHSDTLAACRKFAEELKQKGWRVRDDS